MNYRTRVLGFLFFLAIITYLDRVCIAVAGKTIQEDLGLTPSQWGWVLGSFALAYCLFEIPSGAMGDRVGPRRVLTRIVIWWSAFTALTGAARGFGSLVAVRFLFGAGEAGAFPNIAAVIARWFPLVARARAQGFVWMATRIGGALSPVIVIPIQQAFGWRTSFYIFGAVGVAWALVWYAWFRDDPAQKQGVSAAEIAELGAQRVVNTSHGLPWGQALRSGTLWALFAMYFLYCWSAFFYLSWLHLFLENGRGYSKAELVKWSWLPFVFGGCANFVGGWLSDVLTRRIGLKWGRRAIGLSGLIASGLFIGAAVFTEDKVLTVVLLSLGFAGSDFTLPVSWAVCGDIGRRHVGAVSGAMNMAGQAASFLTAVTFGYIVTATGSYNAPLVPMAILSIVAGLLWLVIDPTKPLISEPAPAHGAAAV